MNSDKSNKIPIKLVILFVLLSSSSSLQGLHHLFTSHYLDHLFLGLQTSLLHEGLYERYSIVLYRICLATNIFNIKELNI